MKPTEAAIDKTLQQYLQLPVRVEVEKSIGQNGVATNPTNSQNSQNQESRWSPNHSKHEMPVSATDGINKSAKSLFSEGVWQRARRYGCKKLQYLYQQFKESSDEGSQMLAELIKESQDFACDDNDQKNQLKDGISMDGLKDIKIAIISNSSNSTIIFN